MRVAAYQFAVTGDLTHNFSMMEQALQEAAAQGVDLLVFPECALTGYPPRDLSHSAQTDFDTVMRCQHALQSLADKHNIPIIVGAIASEHAHFYNRALLFTPHMPLRFYDKRALWGYDADNFSAGESDGIFLLGNVKIGIRICYEVRFPEYFRELYRAKADLGIVLFYDVLDKDDVGRYQLIKGHLQTRAAENVMPLLAVNTTSPYQTAPTCLIDRSGRVLAECTRNKSELLVFDWADYALGFGERGRKQISDSLCRKNG